MNFEYEYNVCQSEMFLLELIGVACWYAVSPYLTIFIL